MTVEKIFTIKDYPNDVYTAVGKIIQISQEWEEEYKKLARLLQITVKKIEKSSLNKLNEALKKEGMLTDKEFGDLKEVIRMRNYINHQFFLTDFKKQYASYDEGIMVQENILNAIYFFICEATDMISNKIDILENRGCLRPTVFDRK